MNRRNIRSGLSGPSAPALLAGLGLALAAALPVAAAPRGEVTIAQPVIRQQYDPTNQVAATDYLVYDKVFDGLLNLEPDGKKPALALSWEVSADGKQLDFRLREGVKFHNGDPFSAEDVKFTFERILLPDNTHSYRGATVESLERVEVLGPYHVRFHLKKSWPAFFTSSRYAMQGILPKKYFESVGARGFQEKPVGTGPFKVAEVRTGELTRYDAHTEYWGKVSNVQRITERLVQEPFGRYAMLERGEVDIVMDLTGPLLERIRTNPKVRIISAKYSGTSGMYFNKTKFPESADRRVRMAVAHALNREQVASTILNGVCEMGTSIFTPATFGYLEGLEPIKHDPAKAKALLAEAGIKPGHEISFSIHTQSFSSLPNAPLVLEVFAGNLEAVGFKVTREPLETGAWLAMMRGAKQPSVFYGPSSLPDDGGETINSWFRPNSVWSSGNINVPQYDEMFRAQLQVSDLKAREKILHDFARLEHERREGLPLFWCDTPFAVGPRVKDWKLGLGSGYHMKLNTLVLAD